MSRGLDPSGYIDDRGRVRSAGGYLENIPIGSNDFRRDYSRQEGWETRNVDWWTALGLQGGRVYGYDAARGLFPLNQRRDPRYGVYAGEPVPDYDGPYLMPEAARRAQMDVPPWAHHAPRQDARTTTQGFSTPGTAGAFLRAMAARGRGRTGSRCPGTEGYNWRERVRRSKEARMKAKLAGRR